MSVAPCCSSTEQLVSLARECGAYRHRRAKLPEGVPETNRPCASVGWHPLLHRSGEPTGRTENVRGPRSFIARLTASDSRITAHFGRLERRPAPDKAAKELRQYLANLPTRIDPAIYRELSALASRHESAHVYSEKAVDVMMAVDIVVMAERHLYDAAYLLTADGDFTPAVQAVRELGKAGLRRFSRNRLPARAGSAFVHSAQPSLVCGLLVRRRKTRSSATRTSISSGARPSVR